MSNSFGPSRKSIAEDTLARTESIIAEHASKGASLDSTFISQQSPPLDQANCPKNPPTKVEIFNSDSFTLARQIIAEDPSGTKGKTAVLNLASDIYRAGGWLRSLSTTQEEALCYSSTLYATLKPDYYPWPNVGEGSVSGVYSPGVVIFKDDLDNRCRDLELSDRQVVSVLTVAAPRHPALTPDRAAFEEPSVLEDMKGKVRLVYRMAAHRGQQYLVLGAMGCGVYGCPSRLVAELMRDILLEPEFDRWFRRVVFAVYSKSPYEPKPTNFEIFTEVFANVTVNTTV
ncbi:hypothetical protein EST38_g1494 [Candolleomyces aberdarensis]|uniref:Microbial-type PARG catalytic domain-containing protein n=1 Tax=Candolleomyces aberdarensis TaxID=2316362 RepID=A0A4Q2DUW1_9AGAR|nr:hypothetical protein EST38_g1494 [Candolleomyces aberdarensis]